MKAKVRSCIQVIITILFAYAVHAQNSSIDLPVNQATSYKGEEFLLIGDANRGGGEPVIAISLRTLTLSLSVRWGTITM